MPHFYAFHTCFTPALHPLYTALRLPSVDVPVGKYGVIATMPHFYAFYEQQFEVAPGATTTLQVRPFDQCLTSV